MVMMTRGGFLKIIRVRMSMIDDIKWSGVVVLLVWVWWEFWECDNTHTHNSKCAPCPRSKHCLTALFPNNLWPFLNWTTTRLIATQIVAFSSCSAQWAVLVLFVVRSLLFMLFCAGRQRGSGRSAVRNLLGIWCFCASVFCICLSVFMYLCICSCVFVCWFTCVYIYERRNWVEWSQEFARNLRGELYAAGGGRNL